MTSRPGPQPKSRISKTCDGDALEDAVELEVDEEDEDDDEDDAESDSARFARAFSKVRVFCDTSWSLVSSQNWNKRNKCKKSGLITSALEPHPREQNVRLQPLTHSVQL